jgi:[ribosomal protein S18]-alanine N-acetyltransferase
MIVRPAARRDLSHLATLEARVYAADTYPSFFFRQAYDLWPELLWVAEADGTLAGYLLGAAGLDPGEGWILSAAVDPAFRSRGLGRQLTRSVLAEFDRRSFLRVSLTVHPENQPAVSLYRSLGFEADGMETEYFGSDQPRLRMVRSAPARRPIDPGVAPPRDAA